METLEWMETMRMLKIAWFINLVMIICELQVLGHIRKKTDILKYYTYLQNLLSLFASFVFVVCIVSGREIPELIKGMRYIATCGLAATMFMFLAFLGGGKTIQITEDDLLAGFSPQVANAILHYVCPILWLISFVFFERELPLANGVWTSIAAIPSCLYWIVYIILSAAKLWEEPYAFAAQGAKSKIREGLTFALIPVSFIAISFVLWTIR